jgi:hypothetical protein
MRVGTSFGPQERGLHGPALRTGQPVDRLVYERGEQVANGNIGKTNLRLSGPGHQHSPRPVTSQVESSLPQRRLADAGISLDDHHPRTWPLLIKQPRDRGELLLPAHDVRRHHPPHLEGCRPPNCPLPALLSSSARQAATSATQSDGTGPDYLHPGALAARFRTTVLTTGAICAVGRCLPR